MKQRTNSMRLLVDVRLGLISIAGPEALAGGPIGRVQEGDSIQLIVDTINLTGSVDLVGHDGQRYTPDKGVAVLQSRTASSDLVADARLPNDTRLWAALQAVGGGTWGGCVYDVDRIVEVLDAGMAALER